MQTSIANPLQNCSATSNGSSVNVRPAVEELQKKEYANWMCRQAPYLKESLGSAAKTRMMGASDALETSSLNGPPNENNNLERQRSA